MDLDVAFKVRENQQEIELLSKRQKIESEKRKVSATEKGDEENEDAQEEIVRKLELSKIKKSHNLEKDFQPDELPRNITNNTGDIFQSRGLKLSKISGFKAQGETEKTTTKDNIRLAQDIKNLSKFSQLDLEA